MFTTVWQQHLYKEILHFYFQLFSPTQCQLLPPNSVLSIILTHSNLLHVLLYSIHHSPLWSPLRPPAWQFYPQHFFTNICTVSISDWLFWLHLKNMHCPSDVLVPVPIHPCHSKNNLNIFSSVSSSNCLMSFPQCNCLSLYQILSMYVTF